MTGLCTPLHKSLDLIGNVWNDLHGFTQILTASLLPNHRLIDLTGGEVIALAHLGAHKTFVVSKIEIGLGAVFGHKDLAMLKRTHGSRVYIDVGV